MTQLTLEDRVVRDSGLVATDMDGETVMMSIANGEYYGISGAGSRAWQLLEQPLTLTELCRVMGAEHDVDAATCQADLLRFVSELVTLGLVRTC